MVATTPATSDTWPAGELYVTGRARDLIIVGGRNIYPQDIETRGGGRRGRAPRPRGGCWRPRPPAGNREPGGARRDPGDRHRDARTAPAGDPRRGRGAHRGRAARRARARPSLTAQVLLRQAGASAPTGRDSCPKPRRPTRATARAAGEPDADLAATARRVVEDVLANLGDEGGAPDESTPLLTSGRIDSFGLVELFAELEDVSGLTIGAELRGETERFDTIAAIAQTLAAIGGGTAAPGGTSRAPVTRLDPDAIPMRYGDRVDRAQRARRLDPLLPGPLPGARDPLWTGTERPGADPAPDRRQPGQHPAGGERHADAGRPPQEPRARPHRPA